MTASASDACNRTATEWGLRVRVGLGVHGWKVGGWGWGGGGPGRRKGTSGTRRSGRNNVRAFVGGLASAVHSTDPLNQSEDRVPYSFLLPQQLTTSHLRLQPQVSLTASNCQFNWPTRLTSFILHSRRLSRFDFARVITSLPSGH